MFDIAWSELALIGAVALIVIGPKDLPKVMRTMGVWTRRARMMTAELQRNFDDMVREAEMAELREEMKSISPTALKEQVETMIDMKSIENGMTIPEQAPAAPVEPPAPSAASVEPAALHAAPALDAATPVTPAVTQQDPAS